METEKVLRRILLKRSLNLLEEYLEVAQHCNQPREHPLNRQTVEDAQLLHNFITEVLSRQ